MVVGVAVAHRFAQRQGSRASLPGFDRPRAVAAPPGPSAKGWTSGVPGGYTPWSMSACDLDEQRPVEGRDRGRQRPDVQALDLHSVGEDQVVCGQRGVAGSGTEHDDAPREGFGDRQAGPERGPAHRFQDHVDTAGEAGDLRGQSGRRLSRTSSAPSALTVSCLAGDAVAIDPRTVVAGEADGGLPHASSPGMHEHHLARLDLTQRLQCRQGGSPVQHQPKGFRVAPTGRHGQYSRRPASSCTARRRPGQCRRRGCRPGAGLHVRTDGHDLAGGLEARHLGRLRASPVRHHGSA